MKRILDFDAIWQSDRIQNCKAEHRYEYTWFYGLADARGSFEIQSPAKMASQLGGGKDNVRPDLDPAKVAAVLKDFEDHGLLFTWALGSKKFGHWVGSTKQGRLPTRAQLGKSHYRVDTPPVPLESLRAYCDQHGILLKHWPEGGEASPETAAELATGANPKPYTDYAIERFRAKYGRKPDWQGYQYSNFVKLQQRQSFSVEDFKLIWDAYMDDTDPFVVEKHGHSLAWFCARFDTYANRARGPQPKAAVSDDEKARMAADAERQLAEMAGRKALASSPTTEDDAAAESFFNG